jgi:uncharacterized protein
VTEHDDALVLAASRTLGESRSDEELDAPALRFQRCTTCGYRRHPAAPLCPECLSTGFEWARDDGTGSVWSFCVYHRAYDPAFAAAVPYNVALVELDSGPRMISNVLDVAPDELRIGLRVVADPREVAPGRYLVYFVRDGTAS